MACKVRHSTRLFGDRHNGNNLLIKSSAAIGKDVQVPRVHDFKTDVPAKKVLKDALADTICITTDYKASDQLWIHIELLEIDKNKQEASQLRDTVKSLAQSIGAVFPPAALYAAGTDMLYNCATLLYEALEKNTPILDVDVRLHAAGEGGAQLRQGHFIIFGEEVDGSLYFLDDAEVFVRPTGDATAYEKPDIDYVVFSVRIKNAPSPDYVVNQDVAAILQQLETDKKGTSTQGFEELSSALKESRNFLNLQRYVELKGLGSSRTPAQQSLMDSLAESESLKPFLNTTDS